MWDLAEAPAAAARRGVALATYGTDVSEHPEAFDAPRFVDDAIAHLAGSGAGAVFATDDYPGSIVAAAVARAAGLPGADPAAILLTQHKYYSRLAQRAVAPEMVPNFTLLSPERLYELALTLPYPCFVKPVKSFFSVLAERVDGPEALLALAQRARAHLTGFVRPFNALLARYTSVPHDGRHLIAEELLSGVQVTVEGCVHEGEAQIVGITDSIMYPGTISFARFEYPSSLPAAVQARMSEIAARVARALGLDHTLFNIEMFYDAARDAIEIIEVNPRMCPQFADLMEKVNGVNTYDIALALAAGERPMVRAADAPHRAATSFVLRRFEDAMVERTPAAEDLDALHAALPDARVKVLCRVGHRLSEELQDGKSYRYAVVNLGGDGPSDLARRFERAMALLRFEFEPVPASPHPPALV